MTSFTGSDAWSQKMKDNKKQSKLRYYIGHGSSNKSTNLMRVAYQGKTHSNTTNFNSLETVFDINSYKSLAATPRRCGVAASLRRKKLPLLFR